MDGDKAMEPQESFTELKGWPEEEGRGEMATHCNSPRRGKVGCHLGTGKAGSSENE